MAYNKVIIEGRLTSDPELKTTQSGVEYCNVSVAVDRDYKNGEDKQTDFIPVKAWRGSAKFICNYFHKGDPILIDGRLEIDKYVDNDGNNKTFTNVVVDRCTFTISKKGGSTETAQAQPTQNAAELKQQFTEMTNEEGDLPF